MDLTSRCMVSWVVNFRYDVCFQVASLLKVQEEKDAAINRLENVCRQLQQKVANCYSFQQQQDQKYKKLKQKALLIEQNSQRLKEVCDHCIFLLLCHFDQITPCLPTGCKRFRVKR